ncbi:hypothetical protein [Longispora albida]|uniref:hypothetical protein n=1 Tax=Longispora albida TaxID=203523 RepID=UPI00035FCD50|nr:hypothetical protein [Longispora albida]
MRNETFYVTVAQVLPALVIALVVELGSILGVMLKQYDDRGAEVTRLEAARSAGSGIDASFEAEERHARETLARVTFPLRIIARLAAVAGAAFLLGELASLAVVFAGTGGWFPWVAAPLAWLALVVCLLVVIALPLVRAFWWAMSSRNGMPGAS